MPVDWSPSDEGLNLGGGGGNACQGGYRRCGRLLGAVSAGTEGAEGVTVTAARLVPAAASRQAYCDVQGSVATDGEGAGPGSAGFALILPASWSGHFMFGGGRGTGGNLASSANKPDIDIALAKGYASATTDSGHSGREENWYYSGKPGVPNVPKLTDYYYRATHQATVATKELVKSYYGASAIAHAYFNGCSNGGRQAITEAVRYPDDFDGIIVGCPWLDPAGSALLNVQRSKSFLEPANYIPLEKFTEIDTAVLAKCDGLDGVKDGLIQNPSKCDFDPHSIVPRILTKAQADALDHYLDAVRDTRGNLVHPGSSVARLQAQFNGVRNNADGTPLRAMLYEKPAPFPAAAAPWGEGKNESHNWNSARGVIQDLAFNDSSVDLNNAIFQKNRAVRPEFLKSLYERLSPEIVADPAKLEPFLKRGGKILMYHGLSDVTINGFGTTLYYEALADLHGGYAKLQDQVRLFLVSGMQHCNDGPDPVFFDSLTAMEDWVEKGMPPNSLLATYTADSGKKNTRTLPLCKFPEQARYSGSGDLNDAKNWSCPAGDRGMLEVGRNGAQAGMKDDYKRLAARFKGMPAVTMKQ
jgi:feruloyl esterase